MRSATPTTLNGINIYGHQPSDAIRAILNRTERLARGERRDDGRKLGLVIEGGAMRAVQSAGGAVALSRMGMTEVFDEVFATSAGTMNAAYFLSNQPDLGIGTYYQSCVGKRFINTMRFWKILDIDWLFNQVVRIDRPLDTDAILRSPSKMFVAMIDRASGEPRLIDVQASSTDPIQVFKAASAMPVFYNRTVEVEGEPCMDGGLYNPFPLRSAIERGCTDILVLLTQEADFHHPPYTWWQSALFDVMCARRTSQLRGLLGRYHPTDRAFRDLALGVAPPQQAVNVVTLTPEDTPEVSQTCTDPDQLRNAADHYGKRVLSLFGADPVILALKAETAAS
ncbi:MAG: patatin-like phospholipase family protein [Phycisphaeraceae bacterium]